MHPLVEVPGHILAWRIPWREEPGELQSKGCKDSDGIERLHFFHFLGGPRAPPGGGPRASQL